MSVIIIPVVYVTVIGIICAAVLSAASRFMYVKVDERIAALEGILPGVNCGACGYPGCSGYAKALLSGGDVKPNLCSPGGQEALAKISAVLGVEAAGLEIKKAYVHCGGKGGVKQKKMDYKGINSCFAAKQLYGGQSSCAFGCLGYGDCQSVCPSDAVCMTDDLAHIIPGLCSGCGLCIKACPNKLITLKNAASHVFVACKNQEKGAAAKKKCSVSCIACGKCARECPQKAIKIENNLAVIDYAQCSGCNHCVEVCITKCIKMAAGVE